MNIYIGNLSYDVSDGTLNELFASHGNVVSAKVITDQESGRSRGFGFVEMSSDSEAQGAIEALNGTEFSGRQIVVSEARPKRQGGGGGRGPRKGDYRR